MDKNLMIETIFYLAISAMTIIVVVLTVVYILRRSSSKSNTKVNRESGKRKEKSKHEEKAESKPILESSSGLGIDNRAISSGERTVKPEPAAIEVLPEAQKVMKVASIEKMESRPITESITYINRKVYEQKQLEPMKTVPVENLKKAIAFKDESVESIPFPSAAQEKLIVNELKSREDNANRSSPDNTIPAVESIEPVLVSEGTKILEESEPSMDTKRGTEVKKASSESPAVNANSHKNNQDLSQTKKLSMGDLSDLFAKSSSENTETNKLATEVSDIDINELLQEGKVLLGRLRKFDR